MSWKDESITNRTITYFDKNNVAGSKTDVCTYGSEYVIPEYPYNDLNDDEALWYYEDLIGGDTFDVGEKITVTSEMQLAPVLDSGSTVTFTDEEVIEHVGYGYYIEVPEYNNEPAEGYYFSHWTFDNGMEVFDYMPGEKVCILSDMIFEPVFKQYLYTVRFNANGGTGTMDAVYDAGVNYLIPGCDFIAPDNYDFDGWAIDSPSGDKVDPHMMRNITEDITLYAIWVINTYNITYSAGYAGPQDILFQNIDGGSKVTLLSSFAFAAPEGKIFKQWAVGDPSGEKHDANSEYTLNGNVTFVAVWEDLVPHEAPPAAVTVFTISFDANGGSGSMEIAQAKEGAEYELPTCNFTAPEGKVFDAWEIAGARKEVGETITISGDVFVKALWKDAPVEPDTTTPETPAKKPGLNGGAIAGIVIGSTLVLAIGGFSVFWFVIKKKSFADLLAIFKKK